MELYSTSASAACRAVMLVAAEAGQPITVKDLDLRAGEHLRPEFVAINPQHCVPTLVDGEHALWESRAICMYLASKHSSALYPPAPLQQRALVDRLLFFDSGTMHLNLERAYYEVVKGHQQKPDPAALARLDESLGFLELFLSPGPWVTGPSLSIADCCLAATVSTIAVLHPGLKGYPRVVAWLERCKETLKGYKEYNEPGVQKIKMIASLDNRPKAAKDGAAKQ